MDFHMHFLANVLLCYFQFKEEQSNLSELSTFPDVQTVVGCGAWGEEILKQQGQGVLGGAGRAATYREDKKQGGKTRHQDEIMTSITGAWHVKSTVLKAYKLSACICPSSRKFEVMQSFAFKHIWLWAWLNSVWAFTIYFSFSTRRHKNAKQHWRELRPESLEGHTSNWHVEVPKESRWRKSSKTHFRHVLPLVYLNILNTLININKNSCFLNYSSSTVAQKE